MERPEVELEPRALEGPAPCDRCQQRVRCGSERLACPAFKSFVSGISWQGARREPTRALYVNLFGRRVA